jgi:AcrR family transcriptional regulator
VTRAAAATRARLLAAAEELFADRGYEGASMRALAERACASVSAAHYHFGSKHELLRAVLQRRIEPINARRLECLRECEANAAPEPASLEDLLDAFIRPSVEAWQSAEGAHRRARHVVAQLHADAHDRMSALRAELFGPTLAHFQRALRRALPDRSESELELGLQLVVGLLVHVVGGHVPIGVEDGAADPAGSRGLEREALTQRMVDFAAAGLRAKSLTPRDARGADE